MIVLEMKCPQLSKPEATDCVPKMNEAFTGLERHGVSEKLQNYNFGVE